VRRNTKYSGPQQQQQQQQQGSTQISNLEQPQVVNNNVSPSVPQQKRAITGIGTSIQDMVVGSDAASTYGGAQNPANAANANAPNANTVNAQVAHARFMHGKSTARKNHGKTKRDWPTGSDNPSNAHGSTPGPSGQAPSYSGLPQAPPSGSQNPRNANGSVPGPGGPNPQKRGTQECCLSL
jgi:hypothetical protein